MPGIETNKKRVPCRLVIFDKDGTLIDFKATWIPLIHKRIAFLRKTLGRDGELEAFLLRSWGLTLSAAGLTRADPVPSLRGRKRL